MKRSNCPSCLSSELCVVATYKRKWLLCKNCGTGFSEERSTYCLGFLPIKGYGKTKALSEENIYDYFIDTVHIDWAVREGKDFITDYLEPSQLNVSGKHLLDISGGNGHFIKQIESLGAKVTLTEFNKKTVDYARKTHGFEVFEYDLNKDDLLDKTKGEFDVVFARACIMFAKDLPKFVASLKQVLSKGGSVLINHSVEPTLGVMLRTQLDEFSYFVLRQPKTVIETFEANGFKLKHRSDETDSSLYVYENDLLLRWRFLHQVYEKKALSILNKNRLFAWPARDRRRSTFVFERTN